MKNDMIYVCYASSDFYARETGISMIGFFENNPYYEPEEFFILDYGILEPNKEKLNGIAQKYGRYITYLPAKQILEDIQLELNLKDFRGSLATYSRAFIDKIIPEYVNKLFYIDSDTVVTGSIKELDSFNMGNACMAGIYSASFTNCIKRGKWQLYSQNNNYYGCGIVLFDLNNWRKNNCYEKIANMLTVKKCYPCADQTLINNSLSEKLLKKLPLKYNYTTHIYSKAVEKGYLHDGDNYSNKEIEEAINTPVVIHYPGIPLTRPWFENCQSRRSEVYYLYKSMSPWSTDDLYKLDDYYRQMRKLRNIFTYMIQSLNIKSPSYSLLRVISSFRNMCGNCLRIIGVYKPLSKEGME